MSRKNALLVLVRFAAWYAEQDEDTQKEVCDGMNSWFDDQGDMFGTEGQLDPRGDQRD